ncbi:MAG: YhfC family intramembrane metalloprotease [Lachnospiraceae bacterium]|nr:YhfC family intramembrane metalloprotease [Lachnospiraceae bacterium]
MLIASLIFGSLICFGVPVGGLIILLRRKRGAGKAFFLGMLAFSVSQLGIRIPVLQLLLPRWVWFHVLQLYPWAYGLFLGLTAGVFEEGARWIAIRFFLKDRTDLEHGLAFGLGHGGVEAMILAGLNMTAGLMMVLTGQGALFPATSQTVLISGLERLYAMAFHVGASLLVMCGIRKKRTAGYLTAAVALHTVMDAAIVILPAVFGAGIAVIELYGAAVGLLTLTAGVLAYCRRK